MAANDVERGPVTPTSAPPMGKPLTEEERQQRFAELRRRMGRSMLEVKGPPGLTPYWAPKDDSTESTRLELLGFSIVRDDPKNRKWLANGFREDGTFVLGDVILMSIESDVYEFLLQEGVEKNLAMRKEAIEGVKVRAAEAEVPTFDVTRPSRRR